MAFRIPRVPIPRFFPVRYYMTLMCFLGLMISYISRFALSIAILKMVAPPPQHFSAECALTAAEAARITPNDTFNFNWTESEQGILFSGLFYGYVVFQIPAGFAADMLGAVPVMLCGSFMTTATTLFTPEVANVGPTMFLLLRIALGAGQATMFIPIHCIINAWIPKKEMSTVGSIIFGGAQIGNSVNNFLTGALIGAGGLHWSVVFRLYGGIALVWTLVFMFTAYSYPDQCKCLTEKEAAILEQAGCFQRKRPVQPPWVAILVNARFWVGTSATFGHDWMLFSIATELPKFFMHVLRVDINVNSYVNGAMFILTYINGIIGGVLSDLINKKQWMSLNWNRKLFLTISSVAPSVGMILSVYSNCNAIWAMMALLIFCSFMGFSYCSIKLTPLDLAPNFSGTVSSIMNCVGSTAGIIAPSIIGVMTPNGSLGEWRAFMWVTFAVMTATNLSFIAFGVAKAQPFNSPEDKAAALEEKSARKKKEASAKLSKEKEAEKTDEDS